MKTIPEGLIQVHYYFYHLTSSYRRYSHIADNRDSNEPGMVESIYT
jgi:hypothetical protein